MKKYTVFWLVLVWLASVSAAFLLGRNLFQREMLDLYAHIHTEKEASYGEGLADGYVGTYTFYAEIREIDDHSMVVDGLDINDVNFQGAFRIYHTKAEIRYNVRQVEWDFLSVGDIVSVTFSGSVREMDPAVPEDVVKIAVQQQKSRDAVVS